MVHLGHHVRRQRQDSNVAPKAGFRIFNDTFAFFEVQHQRQDKETRVQMLSHIFDPRRRSAAHVIHHRSAYHPPSHPNLAAHADPAFRARTHLGKRSDKSCLLLFLPLALPEGGHSVRCTLCTLFAFLFGVMWIFLITFMEVTPRVTAQLVHHELKHPLQGDQRGFF